MQSLENFVRLEELASVGVFALVYLLDLGLKIARFQYAFQALKSKNDILVTSEGI